MLLNQSDNNFEDINELLIEIDQLNVNRTYEAEIKKLKEYVAFLKEDNEKLHRNLLISEKENTKLKKGNKNL